MLGVFAAIFSCKEDEPVIDTPVITSYQTVDEAFMGDSIPISIVAAGDYPLNQIKITFFQNNQQVSENIIPTKDPGSFDKKIIVPFVKDLADGPAEIQLMVKNKNFNYSTVLIPIEVKRPKFPYLTLKTQYGDYRMEPVVGKPYEYAVTADFPSGKIPAVIQAPAFGENGNAILFGGEVITANAQPTDLIPFEKVGTTNFTVTFNTLTFKASPFLKPAIVVGDEAVEFPDYTAGRAVLDLDITQGDIIKFDGILDIASWWKDPSFLEDQGSGNYKFRAISGKYRITADNNLKYFNIEPLDEAGELLNFDPATKTGAIWLNGGNGFIGEVDNRIGFPSYQSNSSSWNPQKNHAMAPIGNNRYEMILKAGETIFPSNISGQAAGFAFYGQSRSVDQKLAIDLVQSFCANGNTVLTGTAPYAKLEYNKPQGDLGTLRFDIRSDSGPQHNNQISTGSNRSIAGGVFRVVIDVTYTPYQVFITKIN